MIRYDRQMDRLFVTLHDPPLPAYSAIENGVIVRRCLHTNEIVGFEIEHFTERAFSKRDPRNWLIRPKSRMQAVLRYAEHGRPYDPAEEV